MGRRFYTDGMIASCFWPTVTTVFLLIPFSPCCKAGDRCRQQETSSGSSVHDFQDVKKEVGYVDPERFGKVKPTTLISWVLIGAGIWCLIAIFLYAYFTRSSTDKLWLEEQNEEGDDFSCFF